MVEDVFLWPLLLADAVRNAVGILLKKEVFSD